MPLFNSKKTAKFASALTATNAKEQQFENNNFKNAVPTAPTIHDDYHDTTVQKPQLVFNCQLAHGSPTGFISGFASVKELYQKIAECYDMSVDEVSRILASLP